MQSTGNTCTHARTQLITTGAVADSVVAAAVVVEVEFAAGHSRTPLGDVVAAAIDVVVAGAAAEAEPPRRPVVAA